ncbi:MAG: hypothetical protein JXA07_06225 [Spirochaetes bacterium]|nr:hypothetical protein [Spirochaetota bacterium]
MESGVQLRVDWIGVFADSLLSQIGSAASKVEALNRASELVSSRIDEYRRDILENPDEISLSLIDLLDQIAFELAESNPADAAVQDYIIDDLYGRLSVYLDILKSREIYDSNLRKRYITREDAIIMRQCRMKECAPLLMSEFYEQPALQKPILHTLVSFDGDDLLNFYYDIAKESDAVDMRALALVGLKGFGTKFRRWRQLSSGDDEGYLRMIAYAESFDAAAIERNDMPVPGDLNTSMFVLHYVESHIESITGHAALAWVLEALHSFLSIRYYNSSLAVIHDSICSILLFARTDTLQLVLDGDACVKKLLELIDFLPRELFERIVPKLALMGNDFIRRVNGMVGAGKVKLNERESNALSYIIWMTGNAL